ncbi:metallopeptidase family protein [Microbaculum marinisediminis]|uniref:Metallopeptidase family protein n=1 Tax=Microbaculum marinisediminis TaxID=2931392 RepID=A0AAW5R0P7_9HYPH|nr:metallopeptidase family protein [Microbaculum sp. A6E488]MCT8972271.1 metallopeptidase family protein [Microbaculum sp. A6E488]
MARANPFSVWQDRQAPTLDDVQRMAADAFANLPGALRQLCGDIVIQVAEFPEDEVLDDMGLETAYDLLGLFQGTGLAHRGLPYTGEMPNMIWLYRRPLIDYWAESEETLGHLVTHVLIHEIGHHFGLSDDDMEAIEAQARD